MTSRAASLPGEAGQVPDVREPHGKVGVEPPPPQGRVEPAETLFTRGHGSPLSRRTCRSAWRARTYPYPPIPQIRPTTTSSTSDTFRNSSRFDGLERWSSMAGKAGEKERVADGDARVGVAGGIDHDPVDLVPRLLEPVDDLPLVVRLEERHRRPLPPGGGGHVLADVLERLASVDGGLPLPQDVQVGAVDEQDPGERSFSQDLPRPPGRLAEEETASPGNDPARRHHREKVAVGDALDEDAPPVAGEEDFLPLPQAVFRRRSGRTRGRTGRPRRTRRTGPGNRPGRAIPRPSGRPSRRSPRTSPRGPSCASPQ